MGERTSISWTRHTFSPSWGCTEVSDACTNCYAREDWGDGHANVWLGATVVTQEEADRDVPKLLAVPAMIRFLSCEPLLSAIDLRGLFHRCPTHDYAGGFCIQDCGEWRRINWVIAGSESGRRARPCDLAWVRNLRDQCIAAGVAFHWKQHIVDGIKLHTPELDGKRWVEFPRDTNAS